MFSSRYTVNLFIAITTDAESAAAVSAAIVPRADTWLESNNLTSEDGVPTAESIIRAICDCLETLLAENSLSPADFRAAEQAIIDYGLNRALEKSRRDRKRENL